MFRPSAYPIHLIFLLLFLDSHSLLAQTKLKPVLQEFHIAEVVVECQNSPGLEEIKIQDFIFKKLPQNTTSRPIRIRIKELTIEETIINKIQTEGRVLIKVSYDLRRDNKYIHLTDYSGGLKYTRGSHQPVIKETAIKQSLTDVLKFITNWMHLEIRNNPRLAQKINLIFTDYSETGESDTVYYSFKRPLTWDDFQAKPLNNKYAASVFPGFGYEQENEIVEGILNVHLKLKVYIMKSASAVSYPTPYGLNHEQRHFDIVKIVSDRFKKRIQAQRLNIENYEGIIGFEYIESLREMNRLQKQYDTETRHGLDQSTQKQWDSKIDQELNNKYISDPDLEKNILPGAKYFLPWTLP